MSKNQVKRWKLLLPGIFMLFLCSVSSFGQSVRGTVVDETNTPLPGVNVAVKGSKTATITDMEGSFTLQGVDLEKDVLIFSFIGMETQEIPISGKTQLSISMKSSETVLGEVVAIGYGTAKKKDITGSVSSVQGKDLQLIPVSTAAEALTGKMAGVQVVTTEGSPDAAINIRIRGGGSITQDNSPLYIVDGFPVNSISDIPASSIQSIDVLKDASSTAIYGARGANGVIIITTKGGSEGKVKVNYNAYYGFKKVANHLKTLGTADYVKWQYEYALLSNNLSDYQKYFGQYQDIDLYDGQPATNWYDQVFGHIGNAFNQDLTISGGSDKFKYSFGYAGLTSKEIMLNSKFSRNNFSLKLDHNPNKKIGLSFSVRYSDTKIGGAGSIDQTGAGNITDSRVKQTMIFSPIPFTSLGDFSDDEVSSSMINPLVNVSDNDRNQLRRRYNLGASFSWKIIDDLEFRSEAGLDYYVTNDDRYFGLSTYYVKTSIGDALYQNHPATQSVGTKSQGIRNTNTLNYDFKNIINNADHSLKLLVGQEAIYTQSNTITNLVWNFPTFFTSDLAFKLSGQGYSKTYTDVNNPDDKLLSFFSRVNYDFKGRYLFSATFRADGSSRFDEGNHWGYFPSAAVAWRVSEEDFMKGTSSWLDNLKLRLSYGTAGNNNIPSRQFKQEFQNSTTSYVDGASIYWAPANRMANPNLKWETTYTRNAGLDFGFLKNRLNGSVELYQNTTKDLLIDFPTSGTAYSSQYRNLGETENKGFEFSLNWIAINKEKYGLNIGFNIGFNKNKIKSLGINDFGRATSWASTEIGNDYWISAGGALGQMYGYNSDGRYEVSDFQGYDAVANTWTLNQGVVSDAGVIGQIRPGSMKLKDITGDGIVDINDCSVIGNANPVHTGGFTIDARFYGFDLSAVFNWSYGNKIYNANKIEYTTGRYAYRNMIDIMADGKRWTNVDANGTLVNDPATLEAMNATTTMWSPYMSRHVFSDWAVEDGSFLRLNTLSLGYTIPADLVKKAHIQNLRLYVSAYNLFILTNYSGFDPEVSSRRNDPLTPGVDYSAYPKSRQLLFGLNLSF